MKNGNKILLILRHAKSSWKESDLQDHDRPLSKRGKRDAPRMGELLKELELVPDLIISSTAKRAKDTAKAVVKSSEYKGMIELNPSLYGAGVDGYLAALRVVPDAFNKVLIIGHNPALEELVGVLTGKMEHMSTCALAEVDLKIAGWGNVGSNKIEGQLINTWRSRE